METKDKKSHLIYTLSRKALTCIIIYFTLLLIGGVILSVYTLSNIDTLVNKNLLLWTSVCSVGVSCVFSSIQYLKVLYKACITNRIGDPNNKSYEQIGNIVYFISRPIFASAFTVILIFSMLSGLIVVTSSVYYVINDRFLYLSVITSSIVGFSIGTVLDKFELFSKKQISKNVSINDSDMEEKFNESNEK